MDKNHKGRFFEKYCITFFWIMFLIVSVVPSFILQIVSNNNYPEEYIKTTLVFDHVEDENTLVYKYDVDGETYTYKTENQNKKIPKVGKEYNYYYNKEKPQEVFENNRDKDTTGLIAVSAFFGGCIILSIIGAKLGGAELSMQLSFILLDLLFVAGCMFGLVSVISTGFPNGFSLDELIGIVLVEIFFLFFTIMTISVEILLVKEVIKFFNKGNKKKK